MRMLEPLPMGGSAMILFNTRGNFNSSLYYQVTEKEELLLEDVNTPLWLT
jgi:hypothetical protein